MSGKLVANLGMQTRAKKALAAHLAVEGALRTAVDKAIEAGQHLLALKAAVPHGQWEEWFRSYFIADKSFSLRTAQVYMRLAANAEKVMQNQEEVGRSLGVNEALRLLAHPDEVAAAKVDPAHLPVATGKHDWNRNDAGRVIQLTDIPLASRRDSCERWNDVFWKNVLLLSAADKSEAEIAEFLGMPVERVALLLRPKMPELANWTGIRDGAAVRHRVSAMTWRMVMTWRDHAYNSAAWAAHATEPWFTPHVETLKGKREAALIEWQSACDRENEASLDTSGEELPGGLTLRILATDLARMAIGLRPDESPVDLFKELAEYRAIAVDTIVREQGRHGGRDVPEATDEEMQWLIGEVKADMAPDRLTQGR
jgi:hypothetical protein